MNIPVQTLYDQYLEVFPQEIETLRPFAEQLAQKGEQGITDRSTFDAGHVTSGAIVVSLPSKRVLLIDHAVLQMQLQPGGHVEPEDDSILAAAYRELEEETGIPEGAVTYVPLSEQNKFLPFAINVQSIPANSAKNEPNHTHYDFWYLFTAPDGTEVHSEDEGATNPQWTPFARFAESTEFSRDAQKIDKLLATNI